MLPREIQIEQGPDRTCYRLPLRPLGGFRWIGLLPMAFAVLFAWMPAREIWRVLHRAGNGSSPGFEWFFVLFLSLFVFAALMPFAVGVFVVAGRTKLTVTRDRIQSTEMAGPFRWSRAVRLADIERFEFAASRSEDRPTGPGFLNYLSGIGALLKNGRKATIVLGYPAEWLRPLLDDLTSNLKWRGDVVPIVEVAPMPAGAPILTEERMERPRDSNIQVEDTSWSVAVEVPSRGLWKESYGLLAFGTFWCVVVGVISFAFLAGHNQGGFQLGALPVLGLFWLIGLGLVIVGIHLGTRRWRLRADRSQLQIQIKSALRARAWQWPAGNLEDVRVGDSGTRVNERMIEQLQVIARSGRAKTGLLSGRSHEELAWLATLLRSRLGLGSPAEDAAPPRIDASRKQR